jgi:hypothetical protein
MALALRSTRTFPDRVGELGYCGWALWWIGWACGAQGGYAYAVFFLTLGTTSWATGTIWYAARRGYWPSLLSRRFFTRVLRRHHAARTGTSPGARMLDNSPDAGPGARSGPGQWQ